MDDMSNSVDNEEIVNNNGNDSDDNEPYSIDEDNWIEWFCKMDGNHFFVEISHEFLQNKMNLIGLEREFPNYEEYIEIMLSKEAPSNDTLNEEYTEKILKIKEFYGVLHKKFIYTSMGLALSREKYLNGVYGVCPRILCNKQTVLPYGISESTKYSRVSIYCPLCKDVYKPRGNVSEMDGGYFGPNFPQFFLLSYPDLVYFKKPTKFTPKLYGFKIFENKSSK